VSNELYIPLENIDDQQFYIISLNKIGYIIDKSKIWPTRIKALPGKIYRLQKDDFISLGLD
jgi:hypothetical protein